MLPLIWTRAACRAWSPRQHANIVNIGALVLVVHLDSGRVLSVKRILVAQARPRLDQGMLVRVVRVVCLLLRLLLLVLLLLLGGAYLLERDWLHLAVQRVIHHLGGANGY